MTESVRVNPLFQGETPWQSRGGAFTFEPGARKAGHTHPLRQVLIETAGAGRVQRWDGPVQVIKPGDVVRIPAGVKHWHGAALSTVLTHIAITETKDGKVVDRMEHVSAEQYPRTPRCPSVSEKGSRHAKFPRPGPIPA